jgi:hypothetical protein
VGLFRYLPDCHVDKSAHHRIDSINPSRGVKITVIPITYRLLTVYNSTDNKQAWLHCWRCWGDRGHCSQFNVGDISTTRLRRAQEVSWCARSSLRHADSCPSDLLTSTCLLRLSVTHTSSLGLKIILPFLDATTVAGNVLTWAGIKAMNHDHSDGWRVTAAGLGILAITSGLQMFTGCAVKTTM